MSGRCLVFDLDGTLLDSRQDLTNTVNDLLCHYGQAPLSAETVLTFVGDGRKKLMERALAAAGISPDPEEAFAVMKSVYGKNLNRASRLYPGVPAVLTSLRAAGWKIALLSNKAEECCKDTLAQFGIAPLFDMVLGDNGTTPLKPAPDGLKRILDILEIDNVSGSWMVGDSAPDLIAGHACGVRTCYAAFGFGNDLKGAAYDASIRTFAELEEIVK